ncbi:potassium channel protein [Iamia sp. SCSIO 61187]|nr:potassium channel protein [Iamia sp. SCSIO 61187]
MLGYLAGSSRRRNLRLVGWLLAILVLLVAVYSVVFHILMAREGQDHSWATGIYWTLTVMSTLGFGDITFQSDAGRVFSVVVLVSGALFILVLLPFAFIQFVFLPWVAWRDASRAPRQLPEGTAGHMVLLGSGVVIDELVRRAVDAGVEYVVVEPDHQQALVLHDAGRRVMVGDFDDPDAYRAARVDRAALVATTHADTTNTNVAFTVREITDTVPIVATASSAASVDILGLAGADHVLQLGQILGEAMARRVLGRDARAQVIGELGDLLVAEASAQHPELAGRTLRESRVRERCGVDVVGTWRRGRYEPATADTLVEPGTVLILAGTEDQVSAYDGCFAVEHPEPVPVIIIGGGRVGRAAGKAFAAAGFPFRLIEQRAERIRDPETYVHGDAADLGVLNRAGLEQATAVLITTHDDDVNVYLTIYCRRLRPDVQIISRSNLERNVATITRAGADAVLSYASLGASSIWNALGDNDTVVVAEGLEVFRVPVPDGLVGRSLAESELRDRTGCTVIALARGDALHHDVDVHAPLERGVALVLIGDAASQRRFHERHPTQGWLATGRERTTAP